MKTYDELVSLFEEANLAFLQGEHSLFRTEVAERTLCGVLMLHIHDIIKEDDSYSGYYTDVEYNRNAGGIKTIRKTIRGQQEEIIPINCDLILHSRGENVDQDNLIAIEMKNPMLRQRRNKKTVNGLLPLRKIRLMMCGRGIIICQSMCAGTYWAYIMKSTIGRRKSISSTIAVEN